MMEKFLAARGKMILRVQPREEADWDWLHSLGIYTWGDMG
jgi:hypothetical protein